LIETINELHERQVGFASVQENIDTTTSGGKLIFHVFGALAEFERELITERTNAGLASARARGRLGGRPKAMTARQVQMARMMLADPNTTIKEVCDALDVSKSTLYRYLKPVAEKQIK
jgi:DNA invertase Pin-like site-specific DNA recombinase